MKELYDIDDDIYVSINTMHHRLISNRYKNLCVCSIFI